ncbi:MAG: hypothetical protein KatS3mg045_1384 [Bellilinea sp.]|nr:MAG: hypothetical protein KatS3mg045_1384 [Bellilinea sp.]
MSGLRIELSPPEGVEQFREIALSLLEREGWLSPALRRRLEEKAGELRVHPLDRERVLQALLAERPELAEADIPAVLRLRGHFVHPDLAARGMERRLGRGDFFQVILLGDEQVLVIAGGGAGLFALSEGACLWEIDSPARCGGISADGALLALGGYGKIALWDLRTGELRRLLAGHDKEVWSVAFSPDGRLLASGSSDKTVRLWDVTSGREVRRLAGHDYWVESVAFSPDGRLLASGGGDETVRLWDVTSGEEVRRLAGHDGWVESVAFSPDGRLLASGGWDGTVRLWDVTSGAEVRRLAGHEDSVGSVAFSPDGRLLASGGGTVRLWDVTSGAEVRRLAGHDNKVLSVAFSADGRLLVSGSLDDTVRLWQIRPAEEG